MLSEERRTAILQRVGGLLQQIDPAVLLHDAILDSTREQLVIVMQKGEWPILLGMHYLDYVSHRDEDLRRLLQDGLARRAEVARRRETEE
jgi:hypothetical protein